MDHDQRASRPAPPEDRQLAFNCVLGASYAIFVLFGIALAIIVIASAASCSTMDAITQLPEGYWMATEQLLLAVLSDIWAVVLFWW